MNNRYIGKNEIPRWMMQQTPSIGESNSRQIKMVSPEDLQAQSAMYGQVSRDMFQLSDQISRNMRYIEPDYDAIIAREAYVQTVADIDVLTGDSEAAKDGKTFLKAATPLMDKATEGLGFFEARATKHLLNKEILKRSLVIDQNNVNQIQEKTRIKTQNNLYKDLEDVFSNTSVPMEQRVEMAFSMRNNSYSNKFLFGEKMYADSDGAIELMKNTQQYIEGSTKHISLNNKIGRKYLEKFIEGEENIKKAVKLQMDFQQAKLYSEIKNAKDGSNLYSQNRSKFNRSQIKDLDAFFKTTKGKSYTITEFKNNIKTMNLLNKTELELDELSRGNRANKIALVEEAKKQERQASDNKDLVERFYSTLGISNIDKIQANSLEEAGMIKRFGPNYKTKIHGLINDVISDRRAFVANPAETKTISELKLVYNQTKLDNTLNKVNERLRMDEIEQQNKVKKNLEKYKKMQK
jgi:hypothetical protein